MAEFLAVAALRDSSLDFVASTLVAICQRLVSYNIFWDFDVLGKFTTRREDLLWTFLPQVITGGTNLSEMCSTGIKTGRCITAIIGFWNWG
jgi:hypothetical protein